MRRSSRLIVSFVFVSLLFVVAARYASAQSLALNDAKAGKADANSQETVLSENEVIVYSSDSRCGTPCAASCGQRSCPLAGLLRRPNRPSCCDAPCVGPVVDSCQSACTCEPVNEPACGSVCPPTYGPGLFARLRAHAQSAPKYGCAPAFNDCAPVSNTFENCVPRYCAPRPFACGFNRANRYDACNPVAGQFYAAPGEHVHSAPETPTAN